MDKISIIVPCYNEEKSLPLFYEELKSHQSSLLLQIYTFPKEGKVGLANQHP